MGGRRSSEADFNFDEKFEADLKRIKDSDRRKYQVVVDKCEEILEVPFKGEKKVAAMDGKYGLHHQELVIIYELVPDLTANSDPNDVEEVYFYRVAHHDNQSTAVSNRREQSSAEEIVIDTEYCSCDSDCECPDPNTVANSVYSHDGVRVTDSDYLNGSVTVQCSLTGSVTVDTLEDELPEKTELRVETADIADAVED